MKRKWFELVDAAGKTIGVDYVYIDTPMVVVLQDAVKTEYAKTRLAGIAPSDLVVYANRMAFGAKQTPLEVDHPIDSLGESGEDPLIVQVPPVRPPGSPPFAHLNDVESLTRECGSLTTWEVGAVYDIPMICEFMKPVGGCTTNGKIFWRQEEQQLIALLLSGWLPETYPHSFKNLADKKSIVVGSQGVGKSTLLCLLAFLTVLKHKKNVLLYRRLLEKGSESALLYLGWEQDRVVFFSLPDCSDAWAAKIYESMWDSVELWLDGFVYKEVPNGLGGFAVLTTSQGVDLKSQAAEHAYMCLFPSWRQKDLFALGRTVFHFDYDEMEDRFYYSGGSVGDFSAPTVQNIEDAISAAVRSVKDPKDVLATAPFAFVTSDQANRIQHTFLKDNVEEGAEPTSRFIRFKYWEQVVDSEHAVSLLNVGMQADALYRIFEWVQHAGYATLAAIAFEFNTHRVAATYRLTLFVSEYNPDSSSKEEPRYPGHFRELSVEKGRTQCSGTKHEFVDALATWRDTEEMTYWYPDDWGFGSIDSIAKLAPEGTTEKRRIAYLRITLAAELPVDGQQLKSVNEIFKATVPPVPRKCESGQDIEADGSEVTTGTAAAAAVDNEVLNEIDPNGSAPRDMSSEAAPEAEPPIYIAICPDKAACEQLTLTPPSQVLAAGRECKLYVGYYAHASYASTLRFFGFF